MAVHGKKFIFFSLTQPKTLSWIQHASESSSRPGWGGVVVHTGLERVSNIKMIILKKKRLLLDFTNTCFYLFVFELYEP